MTDDLKPCPFCGGTKLELCGWWTASGQGKAVWCNNCGTEAPLVTWNLRAREQALLDELVVLRTACAEAHDALHTAGAPPRILANLRAAVSGRTLPHPVLAPEGPERQASEETQNAKNTKGLPDR